MTTIRLHEWEIDFIKDLLREKTAADTDTRLMARDIDEHITKQCPDKVYTTSLTTGELIAIEI